MRFGGDSTSQSLSENMTIDAQGIIGQAKFRPVVKWSGPRSLRRSSLPLFLVESTSPIFPIFPNHRLSELEFWAFPIHGVVPKSSFGDFRVKKNLAGCSDSDDARLASCAFLSRDICLRGSGLVLNLVDSTCGLSDWCLNSKDPWDGSSVFPYHLPSNINLNGVNIPVPLWLNLPPI